MLLAQGVEVGSCSSRVALWVRGVLLARPLADHQVWQAMVGEELYAQGCRSTLQRPPAFLEKGIVIKRTSSGIVHPRVCIISPAQRTNSCVKADD